MIFDSRLHVIDGPSLIVPLVLLVIWILLCWVLLITFFLTLTVDVLIVVLFGVTKNPSLATS